MQTLPIGLGSGKARCCDSDSCQGEAIAHCDRCGQLVCEACSHPVTPLLEGYRVCLEGCLWTSYLG